jgi:integrase
MKIVYRLIGTQEIKKIYVRLYHGKLSLPVSTNLICKDQDWNANLELFKKNNVSNKKLIELKINIEESFNTDFCTGIIIDKDWMHNIIKKTFLRPNKEEKMVNMSHTIFLSDFGQHWLDIHAKEWVNSASKRFSNKEKTQKAKSLQQFILFQTKIRKKIKMMDFTTKEIEDFYHFLIDQDYASSTAKKTVSELKFLCKRAKDLKFNIHPDFEIKSFFKDTSTEIEDIYLNETEINSIFNYDFSDNETLDIIRDNFIISLWTGFRISDLKNLDFNNFINNNIESISIKTNTLVKIPIHPQVKSTLKKRFENLPPKVNKDQYNLEIKEICRLCNINAMTYGKVFDADKNRDIAGYYEKYKLVSSHIGRKSFATNLSQIMPIADVSKLGGWKGLNSDKMALHYNKKSKSEIAETVNNIWNK